MRYRSLWLGVWMLALCSGPVCAQRFAGPPPQVIPLPAHWQAGEGSDFIATAHSRVHADPGDAGARAAARRLQALLRQTRGWSLPLRAAAGATRGDIVFQRDAGIAADEGYALQADASGMRIRARTDAGLFHGATTAWQLLTADAAEHARVRAVRIADAPRFAWRGLMLDSARHFRSVEEVKRVIDWMAQHKLNTFHWHLTDDQGWRLQIRRYPELTRIGAWRTPSGAQAVDAHGRARRDGGYYTQAQARDIVAYAAARHITVVPEIEMPGHAQAAIAAYPWLGASGRRVPVANGWGVSPHLFDTSEQTFAFLRNVLDEVMAIFPSRFIHVGGDEAEKGQWKASPAVQARMRAAGIADEHALQSWFITHIGQHLHARGRRLVGWDEILEGGLPPGATVMSWRGIEGAVTAAKAGHDVVLSPGTPLYFDQKQSAGSDESPAQEAINTLQAVYRFEPVPAALDAGQVHHVLGAQANLWAEYMRTFAHVQHQLFPRIAALAEVLWSPAEARDWDSFAQRLPPQLERYRAQGIVVADSAFAPRFTVIASSAADRLAVRIDSQSGLGELRCTGDGSDPSPASPHCPATQEFALPATLKAATFAGSTRLAATRTQVLDARTLRVRRNEQLTYCNGHAGKRLEDDWPWDGPRAVIPAQTGAPCLHWSAAPLAGARTLRVQLGNVANAFMHGRAGDGEPRSAALRDDGVLVARRGDCTRGEVLARTAIAPARAVPGIATLTAALPAGLADGDVCLRLEDAAPDLTWGVLEVALLP